MKILQISTFFHPAVGGVERQVEETALHLVGMGHEVDVLTTNAMHGKSLYLRQFRDEEEWRGLTIYRFRSFLRFGEFFRLAPALILYVWNNPADIVHIHHLHDGHLLILLITKFFHRKKIILTGHNVRALDIPGKNGLSYAFVNFYELILKLFIRNLDGYIALLPSESEYMQKRFGLRQNKIEVIPNGIQEEFFTNEPDPEKFLTEWEIDKDKWKLVVGTASRLNFVKGLQNLRTAVKRLPDVLFIFAGGDDGYLEQLKNIYRSSPNVIFTERYLPAEEIKNYLASLDLLLLPSLHEPFGIAAIEAMSLGTPVLATNLGGVADVIPEKAGETFDPTNKENWVERIQYYAMNPSKLTKMREAANETAQQYRWHEVMPQIEQFYNKIIGKKATVVDILSKSR